MVAYVPSEDRHTFKVFMKSIHFNAVFFNHFCIKLQQRRVFLCHICVNNHTWSIFWPGPLASSLHYFSLFRLTPIGLAPFSNLQSKKMQLEAISILQSQQFNQIIFDKPQHSRSHCVEIRDLQDIWCDLVQIEHKYNAIPQLFVLC